MVLVDQQELIIKKVINSQGTATNYYLKEMRDLKLGSQRKR